VAHALLLNATYEPIRLVPIRRAVLMVLSQRAEVVEESGEVFRSEKKTVPVPSVIRLVRIPYQAKVKLARKALAARDKGLCGYCGKPGQNIDHIVPRSRGGKNEWTNVVWACMGCNDRKADKLLSEVRMTLRVKPYAPKGKAWLIVAVGTIEPEWEPYLAVTGAVG
jgi:5-methylcytosine-specific restriction endonuclease McrA